MTKLQMVVGIDPKGNGIIGYGHRFLVGHRRQETRIPDKIVSKKTGKVRDGWFVVDKGAFKQPIARTQAREMKRRAKHT